MRFIVYTFYLLGLLAPQSLRSANLPELAQQANPQNWIFLQCRDRGCDTVPEDVKAYLARPSDDGMVLIKAGEFEMGSNIGSSDEQPVQRVYLDTYYIDKTEVTVEAYEKCVDNGQCQEPGSWDYCNWGKSDHRNHPINCVDWENAKRYCKFINKRLPTEAEWEKAATWKNGRKYSYPSGKDSISCVDAVMNDGDSGCGKGRTWPVGSKPEEINGTYDMAGNVWEWVANWYNSYPSSQQRNPTGPSSGSFRVLRGGSWGLASPNLRGSYRNGGDPLYQGYFLGFRCALSLK